MTWVGDIYVPMISRLGDSTSRDIDERVFLTQKNSVIEFEDSLSAGQIDLYVVSGEHPNGRDITEQREGIRALVDTPLQYNPTTIDGRNFHVSVESESIPRVPSQSILQGNINIRVLPDSEYIPGVVNKFEFVDNDIGVKYPSLIGLSPEVGSVTLTHPEEGTTSSITPTTTITTADGDVDFYETADIDNVGTTLSSGQTYSNTFNRLSGLHDVYVRVDATAGDRVDVNGEDFTLSGGDEVVEIEEDSNGTIDVTVESLQGDITVDYIFVDIRRGATVLCEYPTDFAEPQRRAIVRVWDGTDRAYTDRHAFNSNPEIENSMLKFTGLNMEYYSGTWNSLGDIEFQLSGTTYNTIDKIYIEELTPQHVTLGLEINGALQYIDLHRHSYTAKLTVYDFDTVQINDTATYSTSDGNRITSDGGHLLVKPENEGSLFTTADSFGVESINPDTETEIIIGHDEFDWKRTLTTGHKPKLGVRP